MQQVKARVSYRDGINEQALIKAHTLLCLDFHNGNKAQAARSLGITQKTLYTRLHSYRIDFTGKEWIKGLASIETPDEYFQDYYQKWREKQSVGGQNADNERNENTEA